ncbi:hypothetical protein G7Z17_g8496 [Cylindrodendrum hubeiense]|uniref:BHLH domain-containing protein n=1 Tax=Cylindrodendrum hubeiense TaxID=595255 RepID=A0A9P5LE97_9HYPO|nr:hypothetical protein G7Z17_g8496 [Cylindrodendrum hubeiense]
MPLVQAIARNRERLSQLGIEKRSATPHPTIVALHMYPVLANYLRFCFFPAPSPPASATQYRVRNSCRSPARHTTPLQPATAHSSPAAYISRFAASHRLVSPDEYSLSRRFHGAARPALDPNPPGASDMMGSTAWDTQGQAMAATTEDDFGQFLDMSGMANLGDGMQFDFQNFQDGSAQAIMNHQPREATDTIMGDSDNHNIMATNNSLPITTSASQSSTIPAHMMTPNPDPISNIDAQIQYLQQQKFQQQQRQLQEQQAAFFSNHNHSVPPTPQSLDMPNSGHFYSQAEQVSQPGVYDSGYHQRMKEQDMAFTPLVSPAVTPLDPHFTMDSSSFTIPGAYFSPLTSPALHAQNDASSIYEQTHSNNSPIEMELDTSTAPSVGSMDLSKKPRKKAPAKPRGKANVRSSPIVKPQRRKTGPSPAIVSQVLTEVEENMNSAFLPMPATSTETSPEENSSVSPETLSDMPPPPVPTRRSTSKSPYIYPQRSGQQTPVSAPADSQPAPATPASLMKLPASRANKTSGHQEPAGTDHIESLELPESVSNRKLGPTITRTSMQSPLIESATSKGASFHPLSSPVFPKRSGTASASQSPQLGPGSSGPAARKTPQLAPRTSRTRTGSVHVSPALLPRISPNIKPLLPGTPGLTSAEDAASRLLMSKSNYQNILEGNQVPGVSYPSELSTNLTSKRTSHKIAEQGRRNRINSALQVMAGLLPGGMELVSDGGGSGDKKDSKQANAQNSKASVVENAIVHMKDLHRENSDLKDELAELKKQLEQLKAVDKTD